MIRASHWLLLHLGMLLRYGLHYIIKDLCLIRSGMAVCLVVCKTRYALETLAGSCLLVATGYAGKPACSFFEPKPLRKIIKFRFFEHLHLKMIHVLDDFSTYLPVLSVEPHVSQTLEVHPD